MLPLLQIRDLTVSFQTENELVNAVKHINLDVKRGELLAVVGESGSGKSVTSLSILRLLPTPPARFVAGSILYSEDGKESTDLLQLPAQQMQNIRGQKISMIFQEPMTSLNPVMTCGDQVMEALLQHQSITRREARRRALEWFAKVKLPDPVRLFHKYPHEISGGQKQRVMIAMAICCEPSLLICDEPTTALDVTVQKAILEIIKELQLSQNMGVLFITHDLGVVSEIADRVAIMYKGEVLEAGSTSDIFLQPKHPYTRALIACRPSKHAKNERLPVVADFLEGTTSEKDKTQPALRSSMPTTEVLISVKDLLVRFAVRKSFFGTASSFYTAVDHVSFDIFKGETLGLVGESGCGKTTLGRSLLKLVEPTSGSITYKGAETVGMTQAAFKPVRREVQLVFQDPYSSLNPRLTIESALSEVLDNNGLGRGKKENASRLQELLEMVNLQPSALKRYPHEFSGGQRQRIVIARALAMQPDFLVCDESVAALDVSVQAQVLNLLNDLKQELSLTLLFISHDLSVVHYMCDRIMVMSAGKIVESGAADTVFHRPQNPYTQKLLAAVPKL